jgi:hypothetical protein
MGFLANDRDLVAGSAHAKTLHPLTDVGSVDFSCAPWGRRPPNGLVTLPNRCRTNSSHIGVRQGLHDLTRNTISARSRGCRQLIDGDETEQRRHSGSTRRITGVYIRCQGCVCGGAGVVAALVGSHLRLALAGTEPRG